MSSRWKKHNLRCYDNNYAHAWGGFTLLEIAFITAVLAVLFTMAVATFNRVQSGSRDNKRDLDMHILYSELEKYYESHGNTLLAARILTLPFLPDNAGYYRLMRWQRRRLTRVRHYQVCRLFYLELATTGATHVFQSIAMGLQ